jgi:hypothetical protein
MQIVSDGVIISCPHCPNCVHIVLPEGWNAFDLKRKLDSGI